MGIPLPLLAFALASFDIAAVVATGLLPRPQRPRALAPAFSGLTSASVPGVSRGTAMAQWAGWRATCPLRRPNRGRRCCRNPRRYGGRSVLAAAWRERAAALSRPRSVAGVGA